MPRISAQLSLGDILTMKPVRPQNGNTPAMFRESDTQKGLKELVVLNMGTITDELQNSTVYRATSSLVFPSLVVGDRTAPADRFDLKVRISAERSPSEVADFLAFFRAYVETDEFADLIIGEAQF